MTKFGKNLLTLLLSLLVSFIFAEVVLRIYLNYRHRPFLKETHDNVVTIFANPLCWELREDIVFQSPKLENTYRIFAFGGSVTEGGMYPDYKVNFVRFLEILLSESFSNTDIEVINFAKSGENSSDVVEKVKLALQYSPDLFIIYAGHNEYLHLVDLYLRTTDITSILLKSEIISTIYAKILDFRPKLRSTYFGGERQFIDEPIFDPSVFDKTRAKYQKNLERIAELCNNQEINLLMVAPAGNYVYWQPSRSVLKNVLAPEEKEQWLQSYRQYQLYKENNELQRALSCLERCRKFDSTFAQIEYEYAELLVTLGKFTDAKRAFLAAVEYDYTPKIASPSLITKMASVCDHYDIPYIDANKVLESQSEHGLLDPNYFVDAHHPSWQGDLLIAKVMYKAIIANFLREPDNADIASLLENDLQIYNKLNVTKADSVAFYVGRANWYLKSTEWRWEYSRRLATAKDYINKALALDPNNIHAMISNMLWACLADQKDYAKQQLQMIRDRDQKVLASISSSPWVYQILKTINGETYR